MGHSKEIPLCADALRGMVRRGDTRGQMGGGTQSVTYRHSLQPPPIHSPPQDGTTIPLRTQ